MNESGSRRATILIVDDEVLVRMMLADVLDEAGFKVIEAADADEDHLMGVGHPVNTRSLRYWREALG